MTTRIEKDYNFTAAVHFDNKFLMNYYNLTLSMVVETEAIREQNIAMERLEYFITHVIDSSVFIDSKETIAIDQYKAANIKVCILPEEAYDQIIGMILLLKLNSLLENRLIVTDLTIYSKLSDDVRFNIIAEVAETIFLGDYWWCNNSTTTYDLPKSNEKKSKIVKLFDDEWASLGLSWKEGKQNTQSS